MVGLGFDAGAPGGRTIESADRQPMYESAMANRVPSIETQFVAEAMAGLVMERLATNLAAYLAQSVSQPGEEGRETVIRLMAKAIETPLDPDITDLTRNQFDADEAQSIALDKIGEALATIREIAL